MVNYLRSALNSCPVSQIQLTQSEMLLLPEGSKGNLHLAPHCCSGFSHPKQNLKAVKRHQVITALHSSHPLLDLNIKPLQGLCTWQW